MKPTLKQAALPLASILLLAGACTQKENPRNLAVNEPVDPSWQATEPKAQPPAPAPEPKPLPPAPKKVSDLVFKDGLYYAKGDIEPLSGKFEAKYDDGKPMAVSHYDKGLKEGQEQSWNKDGSLRQEASFKKGKTHGMCKNWHDNGQLMSETFYANGLVHGISKTWHSNGQLDTEVPYNFGKIEGTSKSWYKNGEKWTETNYRNNKKHGMEFKWDQGGTLVHQARYQDGVLAEVLVKPAETAEYPTPVEPTPPPLDPSPNLSPEPQPLPKEDKSVNFVAKGDIQVVAKDVATGKVLLAKAFKEGDSQTLDIQGKVDLILSNGQNLSLERDGRTTGTGGGTSIQRLRLSLSKQGIVELNDAE